MERLNLKKKIGLVSLGCPKNLVDSEIMLGILKDNNFDITNQQSKADIIIINTCGFIDSAKEESINTILEMAECKKGLCKYLIVTGCLAERYKEEIRELLPEVDAVVGTGNYGNIAEVIDKLCLGDRPVMCGNLAEIDYLEKDRLISTLSGYAYLKISEGCNNNCTYCIIPQLRGPYRSRKIENILNEARVLSKKGAKEIILVAQDTTRYGIDMYGEKKLVNLVKDLEQIQGIEWIRLLYCYPEEIGDDLLKEMLRNKKLCRYFDIPIQHISDKILKMMGRRGTAKEIKDLINKIRENVPGAMIRTTFIVGFPGETEDDFEELYNFVKEYEFDKVGVFMYSREEGTPADKLKLQVDEKIKTYRFEKLMSLQKEISFKKNSLRLGNQYKVIVEGVSDDGIFYYGRTYCEAPDIDGLVYFTSKEPLNIGSFVNVKILNIEEYDIIGEVLDELTE